MARPTEDQAAVRARAAPVFDLDARLPGEVFRGLADKAVFREFDQLLTPDAWPGVTSAPRRSGLRGGRG